MDKARVLHVARNALFIFLIMFVMVWAKTYYSGNAQYKEGEKNFAAGKMKDAITNYETAIHMYTPFSGYVSSSADRLWEIGQGFERNGQYDWALIAYRSLRSSFYAVRSFYTPYKDRIKLSEDKIDAVLAMQKRVEQKTQAPGASPRQD